MFRIGHVAIKHPFTLAALSGYSDLPMRRLVRRFGASYAVNEVVLDRSVLHDGGWQQKMLTVPSDDHPVGAQLIGSNPADLAQAAVRFADAGYDVIDINFGCPAPKAVGQCRGGHLLSDPTAALQIIQAVVDAVGPNVPVTVKMRRGLDDGSESHRRFFTILDGAFERGVAAVTVHARTVEQAYRGTSDWDFLARVKRRLGDATVLGSGDLLTARACADMLDRTGVDGVAIARGAIGNPWIFRDCLALLAGDEPPPPPDLDEQGCVLRYHFAEAMRYHGALAAKILAKDVVKYAKHHPKKRRLRLAFQRATTPDTFLAAINEWYGSAGSTSAHESSVLENAV